MVKSFYDLMVWQKAHQLVLKIYQVTSGFPSEEQFGIVQQLRRAAYSIPANIAEGCERNYTKELMRFINLAKGSAGEVEYFLLLSRDLGYLKEEEYFNLLEGFREVGKMLNGLKRSLSSKV